MNILIVGAGVSGIFLSIFLKSKNKNLNVLLFDKNNIIGKKLLATGNGRCNIGNKIVNDNSYNNLKISSLMKEFSLKEEELLSEYGIFLRNINNLIYPNSLSSKALNNYLLNLLNKYNVELHLNEEIIEYNDKKLISSLNNYNYDKLIFSTGAKSMKSSGSDGKIFNLLKKHNYKINELKPGLAPITLKENVKELENLRLKGLIKLVSNNHKIYEENGEVIFKKDGISGISIFNINSIINRNNIKDSKISLDLFPDTIEDDLFNKINDKYKVFGDIFLESLFGKQFHNYIKKQSHNNLKLYVHLLKNLEFNYKSSYDFDFSQVTLGGISLEEVNDSFSSKKEKNIYFIGEVLDVDGLCGGYNIMFAIFSAFIVSNSITQSL